ncbi:hypothetical protein Dcar01_01850 [Deinococcus carri]|uniref:DNA methylase N-4/N-6 domain-containing protein n=1 Tax=Deinococcus carri TaxID=1211323 RepID=A0ABP9W725_9DEIO
MPTLDWIGKKAVLNHHNEIPYRTLRCDPALSIGDAASGNLLVHADNLQALRALLPYYGGEVQLIYIDPPYNTGEEKWIYNDAVNSPEVAAWLGKVVGNEAQDLSRHDKWLCFMYPRLQLLKRFLKPEGVLFVSIDDNESAHLRLLLDEIFGARNFVADFIWRKVDSPNTNDVSIAPDHEHVFCYARDITRVKFKRKQDASIADAYSLIDEEGRRCRDRLLKKNGSNSLRKDRPTMFFPIPGPDGVDVYPVHDDGREARWAKAKATVDQLINRGELIWKQRPDGNGGLKWVPYAREYAPPSPERPHPTIWADLTTMRQAKAHQTKLYEGLGVNAFDTPKPEELLARIIDMTTKPGDFVLDAFAGSGTTGATAQKLERRWIMLEETRSVMDHILPRLRKVTSGEDEAGVTEACNWEGGAGLRFCTLGEQLFDEFGNISEAMTFLDVARHVYFTETGTPLPADAGMEAPFVGTHEDTDYYLFLGEELRREHLAGLRKSGRKRVLYAEGKHIDDLLLGQHRATFKQVPYSVRQA